MFFYYFFMPHGEGVSIYDFRCFVHLKIKAREWSLNINLTMIQTAPSVLSYGVCGTSSFPWLINKVLNLVVIITPPLQDAPHVRDKQSLTLVRENSVNMLTPVNKH